ncbi:restriction endonuclease [Oscillochloris sp. ZM17-4]|uniref:HTH domain-containing protein n=1 Tax=Oscillochloris sp. ZM17-4 TaxID=2866714 RepID=UPI001C730EC6|nr:HTH domain-containing protein [Oscillochloris sp. ZM17-4]MBX0330696.1 restriction endonuclease [Oscillochloris sp. ZM17-4]
MPIPDFQNLMLPMLQLAADSVEHRLGDVIETLAAQFQLSDAERAELLPSGGQARFVNKVGWARTHLGKALLLESPRRGWFHITERGRELLASPPERITVAYLTRYPEYLAFRSKGQPEEQEDAIAPEVDETPAPAEPAPTTRLTVIDAAHQVLAAASEPLHSNEIAQRMLAQGLWTTKGHTPGATVDSRIAVDIKANGAASRFRRVGRSTFTVNNGFVPEAPPAATPTSQAGDRRPATLSFADAAEQVLKQFGKHQPMHYQAITRHALDLGIIASDGQTPASSMYAVILTEIDRALKRGEQPRFAKHGKGMVSLAAWEPVGLPAEIEQHNRAVRQRLRERLHTLAPSAFEDLIGQLLTKIGFENVTVTAASGDGGIDVRGTLVVGDVIRTRMAVQVKRWKRNVQAPVVQQVRGSLGAHEQGLIITTSDFSAGARSEAARPDATPVALMHGEQLVTLLIEHDIGVRRASYDLIELGEDEE